MPILSSRERISHSEINAYRQCPRRHWYGYLRRIERRDGQSNAATRGSLTHTILEEYFTHRKAGDSHELSMSFADIMLTQNMMHPDALDVHRMLKWFGKANPLPEDKYRVSAIEKRFAIPIVGDVQLVAALDVIVRDSDGNYAVVDTKTTYDFYTEERIAMDTQLPEYLHMLRSKGLPADYAMILQLRSRKLKAENETEAAMIRLTKIKPSEATMRNVWRDTVITADEIIVARDKYDMCAELYAGSNVEDGGPARTAIDAVCKMCPFRMLCIAELQEEGADLLLQAQYRVKTEERGYEI